MRALFYHAAPGWSGTSRVVSVAARGLIAREWGATIVCPDGTAAHDGFTRDGHAVVGLDVEGGWMRVAPRLATILAERFVEVVFVHEEAELAAAALAVRLADRGAIIRRYRSGEHPSPALLGRLAARQAPTGYLYEHGEESIPAPSRRLLVSVPMRLGVDPVSTDAQRPVPRPSVGAAASSKLIVCVHGRGASVRARSATVLRTVALLAPRHPELRVVFVGRGGDSEDLRMHAAALGLTRLIAFIGEREDQRAVLRAGDVAWVVAEEDTAAWAYLDAMAMRIPVVAERSAQAQRYVADGIAGMLLPPAETEATAATLATFLANDERRAAMGAAGRARVAREFNEAAMVDAFERAASAARERSAWAV